MRDNAIGARVIFEWVEGNSGSKVVEDVNRIILDRGWTPLGRDNFRILCAFDNNKLVGFLVLQMFPHCEPLYVDRAYRGTGLAEDLSDQMLEYMKANRARGFMVVADTVAAQKLCEARGMKKLTSPVYIL